MSDRKCREFDTCAMATSAVIGDLLYSGNIFMHISALSTLQIYLREIPRVLNNISMCICHDTIFSNVVVIVVQAF